MRGTTEPLESDAELVTQIDPEMALPEVDAEEMLLFFSANTEPHLVDLEWHLRTELDHLLPKQPSHVATGNPRGRPLRYDPAKDNKLVRDWRSAKADGSSMRRFAEARGLSLETIKAAIDRDRKRLGKGSWAPVASD